MSRENMSLPNGSFKDFNSSDDNGMNILKYQALRNCLVQVTDSLQSGQIDTDWVLQLLEQSHSITQDIATTENNDLYSVALNQIARQLTWQHRAITDLVSENWTCGNSATSPATNSELDKNKSARRATIEATKQLPTAQGLSAVAGLAKTKKLLHEAVMLPLKFPHLYTGCKECNRILLYGPPGTGKTHLVNALAAELNADFYNVTAADLISVWSGESEKLIQELFEYTREQGGCSVIFIDEVDCICRQRSAREDEQSRRLKTQLLTQMIKCNNCHFLFCATNCPWDIDPAFLRRFHEQIYIPLPDSNDRREILKMHTSDAHLSMSDVDWHWLLDRTEGFSGSDLTIMTNKALRQPIHEMASSTYWSKTWSGELVPCASTSPGAIQCHLDDLPAEKVKVRDVTVADFLKVLDEMRKTVSNEEAAKFEQFAAK